VCQATSRLGRRTPRHRRYAEFPAKYIPHAELVVIPGAADHEIFVNECDDEGKDEFPEACQDAPGVDRAGIHRQIGKAALKFFDTNLTRSSQHTEHQAVSFSQLTASIYFSG